MRWTSYTSDGRGTIRSVLKLDFVKHSIEQSYTSKSCKKATLTAYAVDLSVVLVASASKTW